MTEDTSHAPQLRPIAGASQVVLEIKNPLANAGDTRDTGLNPGSRGSPEVGSDNPLQYSCLENSMDRAVQSMVLQRIGHY